MRIAYLGYLLIMIAICSCGSAAQLVQNADTALQPDQQESARLREELSALQNAASETITAAYEHTEELMAEIDALSQDTPAPVPRVIVETVGELGNTEEAMLQSALAQAQSDVRWNKAKLKAANDIIAAYEDGDQNQRAEILSLQKTLKDLKLVMAELRSATDQTLVDEYGPSAIIASILSIITFVVGRVYGVNIGRQTNV